MSSSIFASIFSIFLEPGDCAKYPQNPVAAPMMPPVPQSCDRAVHEAERLLPAAPVDSPTEQDPEAAAAADPIAAARAGPEFWRVRAALGRAAAVFAPLDVGDGGPDRLAAMGLTGLEQDLIRLGLTGPGSAGGSGEAAETDDNTGEDGEDALSFQWPKELQPASAADADAASMPAVRPAYKLGRLLQAVRKRLNAAEAVAASDAAVALAAARHHLSAPAAAIDVHAARESLGVARALLTRLGALLHPASSHALSQAVVPPAPAERMAADGWAREAAELMLLEDEAAAAAAVLLAEGEALREESRRLEVQGHVLQVCACNAQGGRRLPYTTYHVCK